MHHRITVFLLAFQTFVLPVLALVPFPPTFITLNNHTHVYPLSYPPPRCTRITPPSFRTIDSYSCNQVTATLCQQLHTTPAAHLARNTWTWIELLSSPDCVAAYYLPNHAATPSESRCYFTLASIVRKCADSPRYNAGALNVFRFPHDGDDGRAWGDPEGPRYIVASERLTN